MRRAASLFVLACLSGLAQPAPVSDFQVTDPQGGVHSLASLRGGGIGVVVFLSARCPISNIYNLRLQAIYREYSAKGVHFIFVNANNNEPPAEIADHAKEMKFPYPVYRDAGKAAESLNAQVTPESFVLDAAGVLRYHGAIDDAQNEARVTRKSLRIALDELLAGKPVSVTETKAFGCTVKRARRSSTE